MAGIGQVLLHLIHVRNVLVTLVAMGQKSAPVVPAEPLWNSKWPATSLCSWKFGVGLLATLCGTQHPGHDGTLLQVLMSTR